MPDLEVIWRPASSEVADPKAQHKLIRPHCVIFSDASYQTWFESIRYFWRRRRFCEGATTFQCFDIFYLIFASYDRESRKFICCNRDDFRPASYKVRWFTFDLSLKKALQQFNILIFSTSFLDHMTGNRRIKDRPDERIIVWWFKTVE